MGFPWHIAKRYFSAKHRFGFISTISRISIVGLAIGIAALLLTVSILAGFKTTLEQKIIGFDGHIRLRMFHHRVMKDIPEMQQRLHQFPEIKSASPYISHEAMIRAGQFTDGVMVEALHDTVLTSDLEIGKYIIGGKIDFTKTDQIPPIVLSKRLAAKLHVSLGDKIVLFSIDGVPSPGNQPRAKQFRLEALYHTGMSDYDDVFVYVPLYAGQSLFRMPDEAHGFLLMLRNPDEVEPFSITLQDKLGYPYYPVTWHDRHANLFAWLKSQQYPIIIVFGLIALVAIFNIMSTLMMIVIEKTRDIGVLKALGSSSNKIWRIFVWNGLIIGILGCILGSGLALVLGALQQQYQLIHIPAEVYFMNQLPIEFHWEQFAVINGLALIFAIIATLYPAVRAARREPIEAIVHE